MNRKGHNAALTEVFSSAPSLPPIPDKVLSDARAHAVIQARCSTNPTGIAVCYDGEVFRMYDANAWTEPTERPVLPWAPPDPSWRVVAIVTLEEITPPPSFKGERFRKLKLYCAVCSKLRILSGQMTKEEVAQRQERYICSDHPQEVINMDYRETPPSLKMRQVAYDGGLWFLTGWMELKDANARWYTSMRLESADKVIYVEEDTLVFQQTLLPSLPWVELVPAPPKPLSVLLGAQARRMAR